MVMGHLKVTVKPVWEAEGYSSDQVQSHLPTQQDQLNPQGHQRHLGHHGPERLQSGLSQNHSSCELYFIIVIYFEFEQSNNKVFKYCIFDVFAQHPIVTVNYFMYD